MRISLFYFFVLSFLLPFYSQKQFSENEIIVKYSNYSLNSSQNTFLFNLNNSNNLKEVTCLDGNNTYLFRFQHKIDVLQVISDYKKTNIFEFVEPNYVCFGGGKRGETTTFPNDTFFNRQWYLYNDGSFSLSPSINDADIDMELAWDVEQGDSNIIVAVLDTGTKLDHPELNGRIWLNTSESYNNSDQDGNNYIDDVLGWNFVNNDNNPSDDYGHGTNIIGIIGANANNNTGYSGMDWNCKLMTCKVLDGNNSGYYSWMIQAIHYAVDMGANVINMSIGGSTNSQALEDAVDYAYNNNVTIVACMMNFDNQITYYPAGFQHTIAVGSTDSNDHRSSPFFWSATSGSNFGNHINVVAPGNYIYGLSHTSNTNYNTYWGGTSQATPQVTALCSLLLAQDNSRTPDDLKDIIQETAQDQVGNLSEDIVGFDIYYGFGRINAFDALNQINLSQNDITNNTVKIFPSLFNEFISVQGNFEDVVVSITNILGQNILNENINIPRRIDTRKINKGIYFINIKDRFSNKIYFQQKIIKN